MIRGLVLVLGFVFLGNVCSAIANDTSIPGQIYNTRGFVDFFSVQRRTIANANNQASAGFVNKFSAREHIGLITTKDSSVIVDDVAGARFCEVTDDVRANGGNEILNILGRNIDVHSMAGTYVFYAGNEISYLTSIFIRKGIKFRALYSKPRPIFEEKEFSGLDIGGNSGVYCFSVQFKTSVNQPNSPPAYNGRYDSEKCNDPLCVRIARRELGEPVPLGRAILVIGVILISVSAPVFLILILFLNPKTQRNKK